MASLLNMSGSGLLKKTDPYAQYAVDLGLPSGTLWMDRNIGANAPKNYGLYFAWGETTGYVDAAARNEALNKTGGFDDTSYAATGASNIYIIKPQQDAANVYYGGDWRIPTETEFKELYNNCTTVWGNGGMSFTSNNNGNTIFFPAAGYYIGNMWGNPGSNGLYWSTSCANNYGYCLLFHSRGGIEPKSATQRRYGLSIRPVKSTTI